MTNAVAFLISLAAGLIVAVPVIQLLRKFKFGQKIYEMGPIWHAHKENTPTMGGFIFIFASLCGVVWLFANGASPTGQTCLLFGFSLIFGVIGFVDDFAKIRRKKNQGLTAMQKLGLQLAASCAFIVMLRRSGVVSGDIKVPFAQVTLSIPWFFYAFCAFLVIVGLVNAVNLTDGVDGLAASVSLPIFAYYSLRFGSENSALLAVSLTLCAGLIAFLAFNFNPAKVFMGDTGSLFLGGAVCAMGFASNDPLGLIVVCAVFVFEMVTVILQVIYFKLTHGKRLFKMAPFHHHLERSGWGEKKICAVFIIVTTLLCAAMYFFS